MTYLLFILGFYFLIKGADLLVEGASGLAKSMGVSTLVIGLTVVAFGTSAPELVVSLKAALNGHNELALGNIIGSNISNVLLMLGVCALIGKLTVKRATVLREIPFAIFASLLLFLFVNDSFFTETTINTLSRTEGIVFLFFFLIFIYYNFRSANRSKENNEQLEKGVIFKNLVLFFIGLVGLVLGGEWIVNGAVEIAKLIGISEALIGLTIVAIGTSLPELAASVMAVYKGETDMAIGNVVGSNIFNILLILGINSVVKEVPYNLLLNFDMLVCVGSITLLFIILILKKRHILSKPSGTFFILLYISYTIILINRG